MHATFLPQPAPPARIGRALARLSRIAPSLSVPEHTA